jgi:hypothetical protein
MNRFIYEESIRLVKAGLKDIDKKDIFIKDMRYLFRYSLHYGLQNLSLAPAYRFDVSGTTLHDFGVYYIDAIFKKNQEDIDISDYLELHICGSSKMFSFEPEIAYADVLKSKLYFFVVEMDDGEEINFNHLFRDRYYFDLDDTNENKIVISDLTFASDDEVNFGIFVRDSYKKSNLRFEVKNNNHLNVTFVMCKKTYNWSTKDRPVNYFYDAMYEILCYLSDMRITDVTVIFKFMDKYVITRFCNIGFSHLYQEPLKLSSYDLIIEFSDSYYEKFLTYNDGSEQFKEFNSTGYTSDYQKIFKSVSFKYSGTDGTRGGEMENLVSSECYDVAVNALNYLNSSGYFQRNQALNLTQSSITLDVSGTGLQDYGVSYLVLSWNIEHNTLSSIDIYGSSKMFSYEQSKCFHSNIAMNWHITELDDSSKIKAEYLFTDRTSFELTDGIERRIVLPSDIVFHNLNCMSSYYGKSYIESNIKFISDGERAVQNVTYIIEYNSRIYTRLLDIDSYEKRLMRRVMFLSTVLSVCSVSEHLHITLYFLDKCYKDYLLYFISSIEESTLAPFLSSCDLEIVITSLNVFTMFNKKRNLTKDTIREALEPYFHSVSFTFVLDTAKRLESYCSNKYNIY